MQKEKTGIRKKPVVRFENKLFDVDITNLAEAQTNLFMTIISQINETEDLVVKISREELRNLSDYWNCTKAEFSAAMEAMREKLSLLYLKEDPVWGAWYPVFGKTEVDKDYKFLLFELNPLSVSLFRNLTKCYTQVPLRKFLKIRGVYAKRICLHLLKFKTTGYWTIGMEGFKNRIGVPKSYSSHKIKQKILDPSIKELSPLFPGLEVTPTYGGKRNRTIVGYEFRFEK